jgi:hypothetical protein
VSLQLEGGELSAGEHVISPTFAMTSEVTVTPLDLPSSPGLEVLHTLEASLRFDTAVQDLGVADLYVEGLAAHGAGRLATDLAIKGGRLMPRSSVEAWLPGADIKVDGYRFTGDSLAKLSVAEGGDTPTAHGSLHGDLAVPWLGKEPVSGSLSDVSGDLVFVDNDLSRGLRVRRLHALLGEVRVSDVGAITERVGALVPIVAPLVLGKGPLTASATAHVTPDYELVRLKHLKLGNAELEGAAVSAANGWSGAAAGHFGPLPLGLRLRESKLETVPFPSSTWLREELVKAGIGPD